MWNALFDLNRQYRNRPANKTNIVDSATSIDPDQPKQSAQAYLDIQFSPPVDFLLLESFLYTSIPPETECVGPDQSARTVQADPAGSIHYAESIILVFSRLIL